MNLKQNKENDSKKENSSSKKEIEKHNKILNHQKINNQKENHENLRQKLIQYRKRKLLKNRIMMKSYQIFQHLLLQKKMGKI